MIFNLLALVGATLLVVRGSIFSSARRIWPGLLGCSRCFGFWVGAAAGASGVAVAGRGRILDAALVGAATSCLSILVDAVLIQLLGPPSEEHP